MKFGSWMEARNAACSLSSRALLAGLAVELRSCNAAASSAGSEKEVSKGEEGRRNGVREGCARDLEGLLGLSK